MRRSWLIAVCAAGLLAPANAHAGGGPVPPVQGGEGVSTPDGSVSYVAATAVGNTVVQRIDHRTGKVERTRFLAGRYGVPGAAYDGATTGLSADGRTLVLAKLTNAATPTSTRLLVLDTSNFGVRKRLTMPGFLSVDAISPDGRTLYVLRYPKARSGGLRYDVMALDLESGRLRGEPIMDPREPDERMGGFPVARTMSADGRWAYTLYTGGEESFVHALDTLKGKARCIDVPAGDVSAARLHADGDTLLVDGLGTIDLRTFAFAKSPTPTPTPRATATPAPARETGGVPWAPAVLGIAVLAALGLIVRRLRSRPPAEPLDITLRHHVDAGREREKTTF
jgi:dipeptidyl aminopeptidase/acylaminoacyl peptidase